MAGINPGEEILSGRVNYVVFGHGADNHEWDELPVSCPLKRG